MYNFRLLFHLWQGQIAANGHCRLIPIPLYSLTLEKDKIIKYLRCFNRQEAFIGIE